jgi:hypothetical protein
MKQKILTISSILFLATAIIVSSCSKKGDTGPAGATGPAGPAGPTGSTGPTGTANVIYSPWLNVTFASRGDTTFSATIPAPHLSDSILNTGMVKVYWNAGSDAAGGQFVLPLPINEPFLFYTDTTFTTTTTLIANDYFYPDTIGIISNFDISSISSGGFNYQQFRYVIVPGGTTGLPVTINGIKKPVNWNDYNEVKAYLGLKD